MAAQEGAPTVNDVAGDLAANDTDPDAGDLKTERACYEGTHR